MDSVSTSINLFSHSSIITVVITEIFSRRNLSLRLLERIISIAEVSF